MRLLLLCIDALKKLLRGNTNGVAMLKFALSGGDEFLISEINSCKGEFLDVGAYDGELALQIAKLDPSRKISSYEPVRSFYETLAEKSDKFPDWRAYNYGLGAHTDEVEISLSGTSSSIFADVSQDSCTVQIRDICEVIDAKDDLVLKLNIEGAEYEVLDKLIEVGDIGKMAALIVQFHQIDGSSKRYKNNLAKKLSRTHNCRWSYSFIWELWERKS
ncbi:FkbM family methyltransferase [Octadecabacter sp.]|nr:FkbM family methyltransferase [Octadecabacter sp.]